MTAFQICGRLVLALSLAWNLSGCQSAKKTSVDADVATPPTRVETRFEPLPDFEDIHPERS